MKSVIKWMLGLCMMLMVISCKSQPILAAESSDNVQVTIPAELHIKFNADGTTECSEFVIENNSLVPIALSSVEVTEHNGWKVMPEGSTIGVNQKKMVFMQENQTLSAGKNTIDISVAENNTRKLNFQVKRGAWTTSIKTEKALGLEFEYSIGKKSFELTLEEHKKMEAYNGETVVLPVLSKYGYKFQGWKDAKGKLYTENFVMPIGNVSLKPQWVKTTTYAVYSVTDNSLTFYNTADTFKVGDTYEGKKVTAIYTGMEETNYTKGDEVPWYTYRSSIKKVYVRDEIRPKYLSYWFYMFQYCPDVNVEKINTSQTTKMNFTFYALGQYNSSVKITGLNKWDTSKVTTMNSMFDFVGYDSAVSVNLGDLSSWNVSSVTDMFCMFRYVGWKKCTSFQLGDLSQWNVSNVVSMKCTFANTSPKANWSQNLTKWNVSKVTDHGLFSLEVENKVKSPKWVY